MFPFFELEESLAELDDRIGIALALRAGIALDPGDVEQARDLLEQAERLRQKIGQ